MDGTTLDSPVRHRRSLKALLRAVVRKENYTGVANVLQDCERPFDFLMRYVRNAGEYPTVVKLRTPVGPITVNVFSPDDIQTINEIFFRRDYQFAGENKIIVDFGSNIGISVLYFLTRNRDAYCYGFEPLPQNIARFKANLAPFSGRFELAENAVGEGNRMVRFGWEPTGRYGGVGRETGQMIDVQCLDSNEQLEKVLSRHGQIDILKVDIETLEKVVVERIPEDMAARIRNMVVEFPFKTNPLAATHEMEVETFTTRFRRR